MPELPEVETTIRGLAPFLQHATIKEVILKRKNLRFDFEKNFAKKLEGQEIINISRRAKYLLFSLSNNDTLISHLGMSGSFKIIKDFANHQAKKHEHVIFSLHHQEYKNLTLIYTDPRRFGFMDISSDISNNRFLAKLGVEPLSNHFNTAYLVEQFKGRNLPIKTALLDQTIIAGLGNIYVCEALWQARIHPKTPIKSLIDKNNKPDERLEILVPAIISILNQAIKAGGSSLKDFTNANGEQGYFQHSFDVYGRTNQPCNKENCSGIIKKITQSGRSSFYCDKCQNKPVDLEL